MDRNILFKLDVGPNAGEVRPAILVRLEDENDPQGAAEIIVFTSQRDQLDTPILRIDHAPGARGPRPSNGEWFR